MSFFKPPLSVRLVAAQQMLRVVSQAMSHRVRSRVISRTAELAFSRVNLISWHQAKAPFV